MVNRYTYDAYGRRLSVTEAVGQPYSYTGREYDAESGVYYYRARYYDPTTGRFLSEDPIGFKGQDQNLYRYVFNNPSNFTDPDGRLAFFALPFIVGGGGAAVVGGTGLTISVSAQLAIASAAAIAAGSAILNEVGNTLEDLQKQTEEAERIRKDPCNATTGSPNMSPHPIDRDKGLKGPKGKAETTLEKLVKLGQRVAEAIGDALSDL